MKPGCLTEVELRAVLLGAATEEARVLAERHLDTCESCRAELEVLAGSAEDFRCLKPRDGGQPQATPALDQVIRQFVAAPQCDPAATTPPLESTGILQYLTASRDDRCLGRLGNYEVLEVVAAGGMGVVLKALEPKLNRIVALKLLAPALAADSRARQRFLREARAVAAIHHDHVVGIFAVGEVNDLPFIAMEFVEGESLGQRLHRGERLSADQVVRIGKEVAAGLAAAHAREIIHRDIKPANVLIERATGRARITDFGLARAVDDTALTRSGFIAGTPEYLSPEQAADQPLDPRSDLFSLGCLLYAACVGGSPFQAATTLAVLRRVADHRPPPVHQLRPEIPRWLSGVIERLLAKDPAKRFATATELIQVLETGARRGELVEAQETESGRRQRRRPVLVALAAALALALGLFATGRLTRRTQPFVVHGASGQASGEYAELQQALESLSAGGTLELRWNGEREMEPVELPAVPLVIQAGQNFHPVWVHRSDTNSALTVRAALTLKGIEFRKVLSDLGAFQPSPTRPRPGDRSSRGTRPIPTPGNSSFVLSLGAPLTISRCLFQQEEGERNDIAGFAGISLENVTKCALLDSELYSKTGQAIVLRGAQPTSPSLMISNCLLFASHSIWMGLAPGLAAELQLKRNSFKGESLLFIADGGTDRLEVSASNNLFASGVIIMDQRPSQAAPLNHRMKWRDQTNLFCAAKHLMASDSHRELASLEDWQAFWGQTNGGSRQAQALFAPNAQGKSGFQLAHVLPVDKGPPLPREDWRDFGANPATAGPSAPPLPRP